MPRHPLLASACLALGAALACAAPPSSAPALRRVLSQAARVSARPLATQVVEDLLTWGVAERLAEAAGEGSANRVLAAELFPHNVGAFVEFVDAQGASFRRTVYRRDFHHNGIRLLVHRPWGGGGYDLETYQIGGGIGVRLDSVKVGSERLRLSPAVQLMSVYPQLGEVFTTTPAAPHPQTGRPMRWTCRTVALELLDLPDGTTVPSVAVEAAVRDVGTGAELARYRTWFGDNMSVARQRGDVFGRAVDERATSGLVLPKPGR